MGPAEDRARLMARGGDAGGKMGDHHPTVKENRSKNSKSELPGVGEELATALPRRGCW
jgi:hypothetical protein